MQDFVVELPNALDMLSPRGLESGVSRHSCELWTKVLPREGWQCKGAFAVLVDGKVVVNVTVVVG